MNLPSLLPLFGALGLTFSAGFAVAQSGPVLHAFDGTHALQAFGGQLAGCGDLDGDGVRDVLAGCQAYGSGGGMVRAYSGVTGAVIHTWTGFDSGNGVADAGDVDADGVSDVIIGDFWSSPTIAHQGSVWVHSGATGAQLYRFDGSQTSQYLGGDVAGVGDVNADGYADFLVGAWGEHTTQLFAGAVYLYSGFDGSVIHHKTGSVHDGFFGYSVAGVEDTDGDGVPDFAVGAVGEDALGSNTGAVYLYSGATGNLLQYWQGFEYNSNFGRQVRSAGDADGDGFGDLIVGAMFAAPNGKAYLLSGNTGAVLHTFTGYDPGEVFGHGVGGAGDVDGDGFDDVIVGADRFYVPGGYTGFAYVYSGKTGKKLQFLQAGGPTARFGNAAAGLGDVSGDGVPDLAVGAIDENTSNGNRSGRVHVFSGVRSGLLFDVQDFSAGALSSFRVDGLNSTSTAGFFFSLTGATAPVATPYGNAVLAPPIYLLGLAPAAANGEAVLNVPVPPGLTGLIITAQAIELYSSGGPGAGQLTHSQALSVH